MFKYEEIINQKWKELNELNYLDVDCKKAIFPTYIPATVRPMFDRWYYINDNGELVYTKNTQVIDELPEIDMPCTVSEFEGVGLYFIAMVGCNPITGQKYYLVKVGSSNNVKDRIKQYLGANPMIWHNGNAITVDKQNLAKYEINCHCYLATKAYGRAKNTKEWFYVEEEEYLMLCNQFSNSNEFRKIAEG